MFVSYNHVCSISFLLFMGSSIGSRGTNKQFLLTILIFSPLLGCFFWWCWSWNFWKRKILSHFCYLKTMSRFVFQHLELFIFLLCLAAWSTMGSLSCQRPKTDCKYLSANGFVAYMNWCEAYQFICVEFVRKVQWYACNFSTDVWRWWMHNKKGAWKLPCSFSLCWWCLGIDTLTHCIMVAQCASIHIAIQDLVLLLMRGMALPDWVWWSVSRKIDFSRWIQAWTINWILFTRIQIKYCTHVLHLISLSCKFLNVCINIHVGIGGIVFHFFLLSWITNVIVFQMYLHPHLEYPYVMSPMHRLDA